MKKKKKYGRITAVFNPKGKRSLANPIRWRSDDDKTKCVIYPGTEKIEKKNSDVDRVKVTV